MRRFGPRFGIQVLWQWAPPAVPGRLQTRPDGDAADIRVLDDREDDLPGLFKFPAHVDQLNVRQGPFLHAVWHFEKSVAAFFCIEVGFQRRCS